MEKIWRYAKPDLNQVREIRKTINCHEIIAKILVSRGLYPPERARTYLSGTVDRMRDPFSLKDMEKAVKRTAHAIATHEKILIFGDYDADGITAIVILKTFLENCGADVESYIPHRMKEGYGLKAHHIKTFREKTPPPAIIITVDCGVASIDAAIEAKNSGIDLIITDHHATGDTIPDAAAVVNPKQPDCPSGLSHLAGVGVVFFFLMALRKFLRNTLFFKDRPEPNLKKMCDMVAIGTMADMVPLIDENRILVNTGIEILKNSEREGIKAILSLSGITGESLTGEEIAFKIAPRLNSAGRVGHADTALHLLLETEKAKAMEMAQNIETLNATRKELETKIFDQVESYIEKHPDETARSIVLGSNYWHLGVLGIVCSRLVNKYFKPVILVSLEVGKGTGSGRSIPGIDLFYALTQCREELVQFGGHQMATGLTILPEKIPSFKSRLDQVIEALAQKSPLIPSLTIDAVIDFEDITDTLIDQLETLQPFGEKNPEPVFSTGKIQVRNAAMIGNGHRRYTLSQQNGRSDKKMNAIFFRSTASAHAEADGFDSIAYSIKWNRWNGKKTVQLMIIDLKKTPCNLPRE